MLNDRDNLQRVFAEIRDQYGLDLRLDEHDTVTIDFNDGVICTLEAPSSAEHLYFHAPIARLPRLEREATLTKLLHLSVFNLPMPWTWLGADTKTEEILLCGALRVSSVTAEQLSDTLTAIARCVPDLRRALQEELMESASPTAGDPASLSLQGFLRG